MPIYALRKKKEDALQVVVFCAPHIAFITHLHILTKYIIRLKSHGVVGLPRRSWGQKRVLLGNADEQSETKDSTYIRSSHVGKSSLTIRDVVTQSNIVLVDHAHVQGRQEHSILRVGQMRGKSRAI